jgi:hypothetical protein
MIARLTGASGGRGREGRDRPGHAGMQVVGVSKAATDKLTSDMAKGA